MSTTITAEKRRELASAAGINEQYLYQCLTGRRDMNPVEARRVEGVLNGELMRWDLCSKTWHQIWPELIGIKGAPQVQAEKAA